MLYKPRTPFPQVRVLESFGCHFVDCEAFAIPRALRRTKLTLQDIVRVIAPMVKAALLLDEGGLGGNGDGNGGNGGNSNGNSDGIGHGNNLNNVNNGPERQRERPNFIDREMVLGMVGKVHKQCRLAEAQLEEVASWSIFQVLGQNRRLVYVPLRGKGWGHCQGEGQVQFHMLQGGDVDPRLLPAFSFVWTPLLDGAAGGSTDVASLLEDLGVTPVSEAAFYLDFLLPHLAEVLAAPPQVGALYVCDPASITADFLELTLPRMERVLTGAGQFEDVLARLARTPFVPTEQTPQTQVPPGYLRDPKDPSCRTLFASAAPSRFPAATLAARPQCLLALTQLGMGIQLSDSELAAVYPPEWALKDVVEKWAPDGSNGQQPGHPTAQVIHAAWQLASDAQRLAQCFVPSASCTILLRGAHLRDMLLMPPAGRSPG
jgi:hypothetical protein